MKRIHQIGGRDMEMVKEKIIEKVQNCNDEVKLKKIYQFIIGMLK